MFPFNKPGIPDSDSVIGTLLGVQKDINEIVKKRIDRLEDRLDELETKDD